MRSPHRSPLSHHLLPRLLPLLAVGCGGGDQAEWAGTVDTLASGQIVVSSPAEPLWRPGEEWRLVEELRIGSLEGAGPELFGEVTSLDVDDQGRIYVLEGQAQEVRTFGPDGRHLRTIGREGGGPGEFAGAVKAEVGPEGRLWVADPQNNRVSVFDTSGVYLEGHEAPGGFRIVPWPGGFDRRGRYYYPIPDFDAAAFGIALARYDATMQPLDTLAVPSDPIEREFVELRRGDRFMRASVPFAPGFQWRLSPEGTLWGLLTGDYRFFELSPAGDTLRSITRAFDPLPVTGSDRERARERLEWFTEQGGEVDWSKLPSRKPGVDSFTLDAEGRLWVWPVTAEDDDRVLDVFDRDGRYLGRVSSPVPLATSPRPVVQRDAIVAVTRSELEVPYVVRLRIQRPETPGDS